MVEELRIGPIIYDVKYVEELTQTDEDGNTARLMGQVDYNEHTIKIKNGLNTVANVITLWHEALHAVFVQGGRAVPEGVVEMLAYGMYDLIRENAELVRITKEVAE